MSKKYEIIYADPAWSFGDRLRSSKKKADGKMDYRELERHYNTMSIKEMCEIPVKLLVLFGTKKRTKEIKFVLWVNGL